MKIKLHNSLMAALLMSLVACGGGDNTDTSNTVFSGSNISSEGLFAANRFMFDFIYFEDDNDAYNLVVLTPSADRSSIKLEHTIQNYAKPLTYDESGKDTILTDKGFFESSFSDINGKFSVPKMLKVKSDNGSKAVITIDNDRGIDNGVTNTLTYSKVDLSNKLIANELGSDAPSVVKSKLVASQAKFPSGAFAYNITSDIASAHSVQGITQMIFEEESERVMAAINASTCKQNLTIESYSVTRITCDANSFLPINTAVYAKDGVYYRGEYSPAGPTGELGLESDQTVNGSYNKVAADAFVNAMK